MKICLICSCGIKYICTARDMDPSRTGFQKVLINEHAVFVAIQEYDRANGLGVYTLDPAYMPRTHRELSGAAV